MVAIPGRELPGSYAPDVWRGERLEDALRVADPPRPRGASRSASAPPSRYLRHQRFSVLGL